MNKIIPFKGRNLDSAQPVLVYRNLNTKDPTRAFSIKQNGLVVGHTGQCMFRDCTFTVSEKGRERVLRTGRKNVHAYMKGYVADGLMGTRADRELDLLERSGYTTFGIEVSYNPRKETTFNYKLSPRDWDKPLVHPVNGARVTLVLKNKLYAVYTY